MTDRLIGNHVAWMILLLCSPMFSEAESPSQNPLDDDCRIHFVFEVDDTPTLVLRHIEGQVDVRSSEADRVEIWAERGNPMIDIDVRRVGNRIIIDTDYEKPPFCDPHEDWSVDFEILVPPTSNLKLKTVEAGIDVEGVEGDIRLETVTGHISATAVGGDLWLNSIDGDVWLDWITDAEIQAVTISGDITDTHGFMDEKPRELASVMGKIKFIPQSEAAFRVDGETLIGDIVNELSDDLEVERHRWTGIKRITGRINDGDARLKLRSITGDLILSWEPY